ncbi:nucleotidyl transferase AbiEii/AbiGii toxin family protein [Flavobacterium granuli]|uniref:RNA-binding protein YhbY n=1 Tax=Flavobacterium granuli TaxID=280093 RepID=A0ABU1S741_9FLAO|nr:nucleotidyl transferase AbiEii/AbiGii toxin family protein [Flavobacterium granuli]MDR6846813.1 RNA-binding protein YhbY [Flavobacterium granuli]
MSAVSPILKQTILELQSLPGIAKFALGGGTNLALRYNHRKSIDIDFISPVKIGKAGFEQIIQEVENLYGKKQVKIMLLNTELDELFLFLKMFISKENEVIKVEFLQNMQCLFAPEIFEDIRVINKTDIGLFKLMSASNRFANKDIYDLDYITEDISLIKLFAHFKTKAEKFSQPEHKTIFDLDNEISPIDKPELLLEFDKAQSSKNNKPSHSNDRIELLESSKPWQMARLSWRSKVRQLFAHLGKDFPKPLGVKIR